MVASLRSIDSIVTIWAMFYKTAEGEGLSCDDDDEKGKYDGSFFFLLWHSHKTLFMNCFFPQFAADASTIGELWRRG